MLFDKFVSVEFRTASGSNFVYMPHTGLPHVPVNIQPVGREFANMNNGMFYKTYKIFTTNSGIVENYRLTVSGTGEKYIVRGRQRFDYIVAPHYELVAETDKQ